VVPPDAGLTAELSDAGDVASLTLNRPDKRNAQTPATWLAITTVVRAFPATVRVLVIRGAGSAFSAGLDLSRRGELLELAASPEVDALARIDSFQEAFRQAARPDLVSIAAVQGHAVGAGFQLALSCDLRIAAEDAQFCMAEVGLGLVPDLGATKRLVELIGYSRAASLCLTGRRVSAAEADKLGLVAEVVPPDQLDQVVEDYVAAVLAQPREAVAEIKALLLEAAGRSQPEQERAERSAQYRQLRLLAGLDDER